MMKKLLLVIPMLCIGLAVIAQTAAPSSNKNRIQAYELVDEMPKFPGCNSNYHPKDACTKKAIEDFVQRNLKYPQDAIDAKIEGKVIVQYVIDTKGNLNVENIGYSSNHHPTLDAEAVRITEELRKLGTWVPGKRKGELVNVVLLMPIDFKLPR